jgi:hypothetical protein
MVVSLVTAGLVPASAVAAPSAETAKRCIHYSYVVYPYIRPGSVRMSGDRLNWSRLSEQKFRVDKWSLCRG